MLGFLAVNSCYPPWILIGAAMIPVERTASFVSTMAAVNSDP